jgi:hypothetical protein
MLKGTGIGLDLVPDDVMPGFGDVEARQISATSA